MCDFAISVFFTCLMNFGRENTLYNNQSNVERYEYFPSEVTNTYINEPKISF
jgi:hypothetical protein